jgi:hypothetical protein
MTVPAAAQHVGPQANADYQMPGDKAPMAALDTVRHDENRAGQIANFNDAIARAKG